MLCYRSLRETVKRFVMSILLLGFLCTIVVRSLIKVQVQGDKNLANNVEFKQRELENFVINYIENKRVANKLKRNSQSKVIKWPLINQLLDWSVGLINLMVISKCFSFYFSTSYKLHVV